MDTRLLEALALAIAANGVVLTLMGAIWVAG